MGQFKYSDIMVSGAKFNSLLLLEIITENGRIYGKFLCDCGNIKNIFCHKVAKSEVKSCGCKSPVYKSILNHESLGLNYGLSIVLMKTKYRAKMKGINIELTIEDLVDLWEAQNKLCRYTGVLLNLKSKNMDSKLENQASLDRIDSNLGYTKDNIQFVSKDINFMKIDLPESEFLELCGLISDNFS